MSEITVKPHPLIAAPGWRPISVSYVSKDLKPIFVSSVPVCEQAALDYIDWIEETFGIEVGHIRIRDADGQYYMLEWDEVE